MFINQLIWFFLLSLLLNDIENQTYLNLRNHLYVNSTYYVYNVISTPVVLLRKYRIRIRIIVCRFKLRLR